MNTYPASLTTTNPEEIYTTINVTPVVARELAPLLGVPADTVNTTLNSLPHQFDGLISPAMLQKHPYQHSHISLAICVEGVFHYEGFTLTVSQSFLHREDCTQMLQEASMKTLCRFIRCNGSRAAAKVATARIEEKKRQRAQETVLAL